MDNTFLVTVADAIGLDATTGEGLFYGKANLTSAFEVTMGNTDVRGGKNNPLLYRYMHDRDLAINIEQAIFGKTFLGLQVGSAVLNETFNALNTECVMLSGGSGTISATPVGNLQVFKNDGTIVEVVPSGLNFTVPSGGNTQVNVVYRYSTTADRVSVSTTKPPSVITLILLAEVRNSAGAITDILQIEVPRLQLDGAYTLSLTAEGVSSEALKGNALAVSGTTCTTGDTYAYVSWIPQSTTNMTVAGIAALPSSVSKAKSTTQQLTVYGIRGGVLGNVNVTSACTYAMKVGSDTDITVGASTGLITIAGTATIADVGTVVVTYNDGVTTYTDEVNVTVTA